MVHGFPLCPPAKLVVSACIFAGIPVAAYVAYRGLAHQARTLDARDFAILDSIFASAKEGHSAILPEAVRGSAGPNCNL